MAIGTGNNKTVAAFSAEAPAGAVGKTATAAYDGMVSPLHNMLVFPYPADSGLGGATGTIS